MTRQRFEITVDVAAIIAKESKTAKKLFEERIANRVNEDKRTQRIFNKLSK